MEVGSPENGFDEISDFSKDDQSTLPEDLDLSFLVNDDIEADFVFNDLESADKFNFQFSEQEQSELPSFLSNFRWYDTTGPSVQNSVSSARVGCSNDVLLDTNADVVFNNEKLHFRSPENHHHEDSEKLCASYLRDSASQADLESIHEEVPKDICIHQEVVASIQDSKLEGEMVDGPDSAHDNEIGEETLTLPLELNQSEFASKEKEDDVPVHQIEKLHLSPSSFWADVESKNGNINDLRDSRGGSKELDSAHIDQQDLERTSELSVSPCTIREMSVSPEISPCAIQVPQDQRVSASYSDIHDRKFCQDKCIDPSEATPSQDHSLHAGMENSASSNGSWRRSQHTEGSPAKHVTAQQINRQRAKRSMSQSPVRRRDSSSRYKRECHDNSEARSPYSRGWRKRSPEAAACSHQSTRSPNRPVFQEGLKDLSCYSRSQKRKHDLGRRSYRSREVSSKDYLPHTSRQNSGAPRKSWRRFQNSSSSKHALASPQNRSSSHSSHQKVERFGSPSHVRRRDLCSGYKRECDKSRSRSPLARDYCRQSPRRRCSPSQKSRSHSYSSHHRSPANRSLSPASCRRTLFVAGFGFLTTERELERKFSRFGRVRDVRIIRDKRSGISRGYGFLSLERDEEADAAIRALHKTDWNGRIIFVEKSIN